MSAEFLPLCDLVFNVVSLAAYFCDVVFDLLMVYTLYSSGIRTTFVQCISIIIISTIVIQVVSLHLYLKQKERLSHSWNHFMVIGFHILQLGMLWRYVRLLMPVQHENVKAEVRDLCILRLIHAFFQAAPMLLVQLTLFPLNASTSWLTWNLDGVGVSSEDAVRRSSTDAIGADDRDSVQGPDESHAGAGGGRGSSTGPQRPPTDLVAVATALSLFTVCWALASFTKHVKHIERLVLTWLGVLFQLLWRLGTISARVVALAVYAIAYHRWIFLVLVLHWICVFFWLCCISITSQTQRSEARTKNDQDNNKTSIMNRRELSLCALTATIYLLAYVNLGDRPHSRTMAVFYTVMFAENLLLVGAWYAAVIRRTPPLSAPHTHALPVFALIVCAFSIGIVFMLIYYRYFHIRRILEQIDNDSVKVENDSNSTDNRIELNSVQIKHKQPYQMRNTANVGVFNCRLASSIGIINSNSHNNHYHHYYYHHNENHSQDEHHNNSNGKATSIVVTTTSSSTSSSANSGGPFCNRKKKKPSSFVPPPPPSTGSTMGTTTAFWRRPLPTLTSGHSLATIQSCSENEGSIASTTTTSRYDIQLKLQEKKQKQLAELKIIEEEIRQGKLIGPKQTQSTFNHTSPFSYGSATSTALMVIPSEVQPIPRMKTHHFAVAAAASQVMQLRQQHPLRHPVTTYPPFGINRHTHQHSQATTNFHPSAIGSTTKNQSTELLLTPNRYLEYGSSMDETNDRDMIMNSSNITNISKNTGNRNINQTTSKKFPQRTKRTDNTSSEGEEEGAIDSSSFSCTSSSSGDEEFVNSSSSSSMHSFSRHNQAFNKRSKTNRKARVTKKRIFQQANEQSAIISMNRFRYKTHNHYHTHNHNFNECVGAANIDISDPHQSVGQEYFNCMDSDIKSNMHNYPRKHETKL